MDEKGKRSVYLATTGGPVEELCQDCIEATDWSRDEKSLLNLAAARIKSGFSISPRTPGAGPEASHLQFALRPLFAG